MLNSMTSRMAAASAAIMPPEPTCAFHYDANTFDQMAALQREFFEGMQKRHGSNLFTTDAHLSGALADVWLNHLPDEIRQDHVCNCCRGWIKRFAGLAVIDDNGFIRSALWGFTGYPRAYASAIATLLVKVERAKPTGVFLCQDPMLRRPHDGSRTHFEVTQAKPYVYDGVRTASQAMAEKREDFKTLKRALQEYQRADCNRALTLLAADALYRGEAHVAPVRFLIETHDALARVPAARRDAILWQAVAEAPAGFCSPRGKMVGTLIDDIRKGLPEADIKARFADKKDPTKYKRPQAPPAAGNVIQAERLIDKLDLATALDRRHLLRTEIKPIWTEKVGKAPPAPTAGVFAGIATKERATRRVPLGAPVQGGAITWAKFYRDVLPTAVGIEVYVDAYPALASMTTAIHADAKPIMRWDHLDQRNPVAWYIYKHNRAAATWGILPGWNRVDLISLSPALWGRKDPNCEFNKMVALYIAGAWDKRYSAQLMLFPELLKGTLHPIRATIEEFSSSHRMPEPDERTVAAKLITDHSATKVRVTTDHGFIDYTIDRLD